MLNLEKVKFAMEKSGNSCEIVASSDKNMGEAEGTEPVSSHSENGYDDQLEEQKESSNHGVQSTVVTTDAASYEELSLKVKNLTEKLAAALLNVSAKDDLVKQHSKVAEEAVAGWEKAENDAAALKQQLEASIQKNLGMEDRVSHIDEALKECVRQLRQSKVEQEQNLQEAILKKTQEWEASKSELENRLLELQTQVEAYKSDSRADLEKLDKIDFLEGENGLLERENSALKLELYTRSEELEIMTIERDLSIQAAETASKQHLEGIKKVAKLEAECRKLNAAARKSPSIQDQRSVNASSPYLESLTSSQSDNGERSSGVANVNELDQHDSWALALMAELDQFKSESPDPILVTTSTVEIDLMGDFLEMERLAALPTTEPQNHSSVSEPNTDQSRCEEEKPLKLELEAMHRHKTELEENLIKMEAEKRELEEKSEDMKMKLDLMETEENPLKLELEAMRHCKTELEEKLMKMEANKGELEEKLEDMKMKFKKIETEGNSLKLELEAMRHHKTELQEKLTKMEAKREKLEEELQEVNMKFNKMETEGNSLKLELEAVHHDKTELQEKLTKMEAKNEKLEDELQDMKMKFNKTETKKDEVQIALQDRLSKAEQNLVELQIELQLSNERKRDLESQLISFEAEARTMCTRIGLLEAEVEKERALSEEMSLRCRELEDELSTKRLEVELQKAERSNGEMKIKQEDLDNASSKLAECQETIASLGKQLKSLATLEDFLIDPTDLTEFSEGGSIRRSPARGGTWRLHSNNTFLSQRNQDSVNVNLENSAASPNQTGPAENGQNGYVKMFSKKQKRDSGIIAEKSRQL